MHEVKKGKENPCVSHEIMAEKDVFVDVPLGWQEDSFEDIGWDDPLVNDDWNDRLKEEMEKIKNVDHYGQTHQQGGK